jgi:3-hydroxyisobutyrate dehydrogenase-like beta-hydroxyacid dehydrogenase
MTTQPQLSLPAQVCALDRLAVVGAGRMGMALAGALSAAAIDLALFDALTDATRRLAVTA